MKTKTKLLLSSAAIVAGILSSPTDTWGCRHKHEEERAHHNCHKRHHHGSHRRSHRAEALENNSRPTPPQHKSQPIQSPPGDNLQLSTTYSSPEIYNITINRYVIKCPTIYKNSFNTNSTSIADSFNKTYTTLNPSPSFCSTLDNPRNELVSSSSQNSLRDSLPRIFEQPENGWSIYGSQPNSFSSESMGRSSSIHMDSRSTTPRSNRFNYLEEIPVQKHGQHKFENKLNTEQLARHLNVAVGSSDVGLHHVAQYHYEELNKAGFFESGARL